MCKIVVFRFDFRQTRLMSLGENSFQFGDFSMDDRSEMPSDRIQIDGVDER